MSGPARFDDSTFTSAQLARMLSPEMLPAWSAADLAAMLAHDLAQPLGQMLTAEGVLTTAEAERRCGAISLRAALLESSDRAVLEAIKQLGKNIRAQGDAAMEEIRRVVYFSAIAAAQVRLGVTLTTLSPTDARAGMHWAAELPWQDAQLRELLRKGMV